MEVLRLTAIYVKRELISVRFFVCSVVCTALMIFFVYMDYIADFSDLGLYYFLQGVENSGADYLLLMIVVLPVSLSFCEDWDSRVIKFTIMRSGRERYSVSVALSAGIVSGLCMLLSYALFSLFIVIKYPLIPNVQSEFLASSLIGFPNWELFLNGNEVLCYLLYFLVKSSMASFYAVLAVLQSVLITNKQLTAISPILTYTIMSVIIGGLGLPSFLNPLVLFNNNLKLYMDFGGNIEEKVFSPISAFYPLIFCITSIIISAIIISVILRNKISSKL